MMDQKAMAQAIQTFLQATGLPDDEYLNDTHTRVAQAWAEELLQGYERDPEAALGDPLPAPAGDQPLVVVSQIPFHSMCAHHLLPFHGMAAVGYLPAEGKHATIVGLGGLARLVEVFARRLQTQERLTKQIAKTLQEAVGARGVAVGVWADHACMQVRGPRSPALTVTSHFTGVFTTTQGLREEFWEQTRSPTRAQADRELDSRV